MQYTANFQMKNNIFPQNIDHRYTLEPPPMIEAVLMSTHNLCFRARIRKKCKSKFYYIKVGCKGNKSHGHVILMIIVWVYGL